MQKAAWCAYTKSLKFRPTQTNKTWWTKNQNLFPNVVMLISIHCVPIKLMIHISFNTSHRYQYSSQYSETFIFIWKSCSIYMKLKVVKIYVVFLCISIYLSIYIYIYIYIQIYQRMPLSDYPILIAEIARARKRF